jgi:hypothetical protein
MEPEPPAVLRPTDTQGTADASMPASLFHHRDYDGRGLSIGPLDHLTPATEISERFAIR